MAILEFDPLNDLLSWVIFCENEDDEFVIDLENCETAFSSEVKDWETFWEKLLLCAVIVMAAADFDLLTACLAGTAASDLLLETLGATLGLLWNSRGGGSGESGGDDREEEILLWAEIKWKVRLKFEMKF